VNRELMRELMRVGGRGYEASVRDFKRWLLEVTLAEHDGNRTHAARALGLERTHLLRLIQKFKVKCSPGRIGGRKK